MQGALIADSVVSLAALGGLAILNGSMRGEPGRQPLTLRIRFGLLVLALLLAARVAGWWTGLSLLSVATTIAAGLVPLATLLLTEGLLRRHAPRAVKRVLAGGALFFGIAGFVPDGIAEPGRNAALFLFQLVGFALVGVLAIRRDRASLSRAENQAIDRIALSLLLILPLLATDYRTLFPAVPVRLGGLAILFLCWLMISLGQRTVSHRDTLGAFLVLSASALAGGGAIALASGMNVASTVQTMAIVLSAALFGVIWKDSVTLRTEQRRQNLIRHLAGGDIGSTMAFLEGLQDHPLVEGSLVLGAEELGDFDLDALAALFRQHPVVSRASLLQPDRLAADDADHLGWLLEKFESTHVMLVSDAPLLLVALNMPAVSATPGAEAELAVVQRMALLISRRDGRAPA